MASINFFYQQYAVQFMSLNLDEAGLFISIPSEKDDNKRYRVELNEETMQATSCNCAGYRRWSHCKHSTIVNTAFAGYKPAEPKLTEVEAGSWYIVNRNTQVWMSDGEWTAVGPAENAIEMVKAHLAKQEAVAEAEQIIAQPKAPKLTNPFKRPSKWIAEQIEKEQNYREIKAQMRELKERREYAPLNGNRAFSILR